MKTKTRMASSTRAAKADPDGPGRRPDPGGYANGVVDTLGARLAALRKLNGLSLEDLATRAGITKSYLSKVERGLSAPSLATVLKLAHALGLSSGQLLDETWQDDAIVVVKAHERIPFSREHDRAGYLYEAIAAQRSDKSMMPFIMRPPLRHMGKTELVQHAGEELIYVLSGEIEIIFADRQVALGVGDSIYFNASIPHRARSLGKVMGEALVVVTDPARRQLPNGEGLEIRGQGQ